MNDATLKPVACTSLANLPPVTLSGEDAHFLAVRLRRLCAQMSYTLPAFASDDADLIDIAGTAIGALLTLAPKAQTAPPEGECVLPPLPEAGMLYVGLTGTPERAYTAEQMREYALAARSPAQAQEKDRD